MRVKALLSLLLASATFLAGTLEAAVLHTEKSMYRNIVVYEEDGQRCIKFGRYEGNRQTCVLLSDRNRLVFDYTKMMMGALYLNPSPTRALIIGLGGGTLPAALKSLYPAMQIDVVEIDPAIIRVASKYFNFGPGNGVRVTAEDGRVFVKRALRQKASYDLVMLDAFDFDYIPEHMLTKEFFAEVRQLLGNGGVLAANTFSSSKLYDNESATYHSVFGDFYNLKRSNRVILVRVGGLPDQAELSRNAAIVEEQLRRIGTDRGFLMPLFSSDKDWPANAKILTDQYSPSNLLNAG